MSGNAPAATSFMHPASPLGKAAVDGSFSLQDRNQTGQLPLKLLQAGQSKLPSDWDDPLAFDVWSLDQMFSAKGAGTTK